MFCFGFERSGTFESIKIPKAAITAKVIKNALKNPEGLGTYKIKISEDTMKILESQLMLPACIINELGLSSEIDGTNLKELASKRTTRTVKPNLRTVKALVDGEVKRIHVCAKCLKNGKVKRA